MQSASHHSGILISIQLNSNQPQQMACFLDALASSARRPERIEVLVNIDQGDEAMRQALESHISIQPMQIRYIETALPGGFFDLWKPLNALIAMTDPAAYFVMNVSDEFMFMTQGWDDLIACYIGYYPDHIFRIRASNYRFRNYLDAWECGFAPDSLAIYTRRWFEVSGDWNPCFGPDSFQQTVAFYLYTYYGFAQRQINRDIPDPFLQFGGEGVSQGLPPEKVRPRNQGHLKAWFILMSYPMQQEARRRACRLLAEITAKEKGLCGYAIHTNAKSRAIEIENSDGRILERFAYGLSVWRIGMVSQLRKTMLGYYAGSCAPQDRLSIYSLSVYFLVKYDWVMRLAATLFPDASTRCRVRAKVMTPRRMGLWLYLAIRRPLAAVWRRAAGRVRGLLRRVQNKRAGLKRWIQRLGSALKRWMQRLRAGLKRRMQSLRAGKWGGLLHGPTLVAVTRYKLRERIGQKWLALLHPPTFRAVLRYKLRQWTGVKGKPQ